MAGLAVVLGSGARELEVEDEVRAIRRHGEAEYVLPHEIDHVENLRGLAAAGCDRVLALSSVGGLKPELVPGTFVCPDDFIALDARPLTAIDGLESHRVPGFDPEWRREVLTAFDGGTAEVRDGGVYWQATGPRLETPAEIRLAADYADVIGMTVASECVVAGELGLRYAAVCVVDNLANGVAGTELTLAEVVAHRDRNRVTLQQALREAIPKLDGSGEG